MSPLEAALAGLYLMLPALVPNSAAVLFGGGTPVDFGRTWRGRRLLGDGKTWRGFFGGAFSGFFVGVIFMLVAIVFEQETEWGYGDGFMGVATIAALSFGSMAGDTVGSFVKRRLGVDQGNKAPVLDQYNFVIGAILVVLLVHSSWFFDHYVHDNAIWGLATFIIAVPLLHRAANIIGYKLGKKNVPW